MGLLYLSLCVYISIYFCMWAKLWHTDWHVDRPLDVLTDWLTDNLWRGEGKPAMHRGIPPQGCPERLWFALTKVLWNKIALPCPASKQKTRVFKKSSLSNLIVARCKPLEGISCQRFGPLPTLCPSPGLALTSGWQTPTPPGTLCPLIVISSVWGPGPAKRKKGVKRAALTYGFFCPPSPFPPSEGSVLPVCQSVCCSSGGVSRGWTHHPRVQKPTDARVCVGRAEGHSLADPFVSFKVGHPTCQPLPPPAPGYSFYLCALAVCLCSVWGKSISLVPVAAALSLFPHWLFSVWPLLS